MSNPNQQSQLVTFDRNPNTAAIPAVVGQYGILKTDNSLWRFIGSGTWQLVVPSSTLGGSFWTVAVCESLNLAVGASAVHYMHVLQAATVRSLAVALNGTTINSAGNVVVTFAIVGGAALGTVSLPTGTTAGLGVSSAVAGIALPIGSVVSATVTTAATVAAGTGSATLGLYTA